MHANNEVGTIQPIAELAAHRPRPRARCFTRMPCSRSARFRSRSARWASTCSRSRRTSSADRRASARSGFAAASGCMSQQTGGRQERNRRAGTENVPAIAGLGVAAAIRRGEAPCRGASGSPRLRDRLESDILRDVPGTAVNGDRRHARAEHDQHQLRRHRGRVAADRARPRGHRRLDRIGVLVGHARAVARAAGDGSAVAARAQLAAIQPGPGDDRRRDRLRRRRPARARRAASHDSAGPPSAAADHACRRRDVGRRGFVGRGEPARRGRP